MKGTVAAVLLAMVTEKPYLAHIWNGLEKDLM